MLSAHRRRRAVMRWAFALTAALAVFFALWWAWYAFGWPPAGASRLAVALSVPGVVSTALGGALFFWAGQPPRRPEAWVSLVPSVAGWVERAELGQLVSALTAEGSGLVALTTGLVGAGGFGKTTLAAMACADPMVRRRFPAGIVWITVGRDTDGLALAARISEVIAAADRSSGRTFTSPEQAGQALAGMLAGRGRMLLVVDDVWTAAQLKPFAAAGQPCGLLVTTRRPIILDDVAARRIKVDAMPATAAAQLLTRGLPAMATGVEQQLLNLTGRWPLLLNLVNHRLATDVDRGAGIDVAAADAVRKLGQGDPSVLDVTDSGQRETAVTATVGYSLDVLEQDERERFCELGIFAADAEIPVSAAALLWRRTAELSAGQSESLCERLDGLSLLTLTWAGEVRVLVIHDIIRDFALSRLGSAGQASAYAALISAARETLPPGEKDGPDWWQLPETPDCGYLWEYLTYHLQAAGLSTELDRLCGDLRFLAVRLSRSGLAAVEADLARSPAAGRLRRVVAQNAHLLGPIEPAGALTTVLTSRLGGIPELAAQLPALRSSLQAWTAWPAWPLPDQPPDTLIRVLAGHDGPVLAVAVGPDGSWLATGGGDRTVRLWNADGTSRAVLAGHDGPVLAVAVGPDGHWLATGGADGTVRLWNADGTSRAVLAGHDGPVLAVAVGPDGCWLATGSSDRTVRLWNADGTSRAVLTGHHSGVLAVAVGPDGSWLATGGADGTVRLWNADGTSRAVLAGHDGPVLAVAIAPDGNWLATGGADGTVRLWDADGARRATLAGHDDWVCTVAVAPDGSWLATGGADGTVRLWNADGTSRAVLAGHHGPVLAVAVAPGGSWLATGGGDRTVRLWNADGTHRAVLTGHHGGVRAVAVAPDGSWLATGGGDRTVRLWNADGTSRAVLAGHHGPVLAVAVAPDGSWLATGGGDRTVRLWNADGTSRAVLAGHHGPVLAVAVAPDGGWLATGGGDGTVRLWNADGTSRAVLVGHDCPVLAVAVAPDGSWLATGGGDGTVRLWAANSGSSSTAIRVDGHVSACAWFPGSTDLCIAGQRGLYRFSLKSPSR